MSKALLQRLELVGAGKVSGNVGHAMKMTIYCHMFLTSGLFISLISCNSARVAQRPPATTVTIAELMSAAKNGNIEAQRLLATKYENGDGVSKDYKEAVRWFRSAAEKQDRFSQSKLSALYSAGLGVKRDEVAAAMWCRKAAEQGDCLACQSLSLRYSKGIGVEKDEAQALFWLIKAAECGNEDVFLELGRRYTGGIGTPTNLVQAYKWFYVQSRYNPNHPWTEEDVADAKKEMHILNARMTDAEVSEARREGLRQEANQFRRRAEEGNTERQVLLARSYAKGEGVPKDLKEAIRWLRMAAEDYRRPVLLPGTFCSLGDCYYELNRGPADMIQAYSWYLLAYLQAGESWAGKMSELAAKMTPSQIVQAKRLADDFAENLYHK